MAHTEDAAMIMFTFEEVVEALIKHEGLTEGRWGLAVQFGIGAINVNSNVDPTLRPTAIVPILSIGLMATEEENNLTVDASKVHSQLNLDLKTPET